MSQPPQATPNVRKSGKNMDDKTKSSVIIAFTHVKQKMNQSINDPKVNSEMIRQVIALLMNPVFMGKDHVMAESETPSENSVRDTWKIYMQTGRLYKIRKGGRPQHKLREEAYKRMVDEDRSTRNVSRFYQNKISYRTIHRMLKQKKMRFYRTPRGQYMPEGNPQRRMKFAETIKKMVCDQTINIENTCFSDECMVYTGRHINRQNTGFWRLRGQFTDKQQKLVQRRFQGPKTHMFVMLHWKAGIIGPIFIEDHNCPDDARTTLSSTKYIHMLDTKVIPELKRRLGRDFDSCWWQQDGASCHTAGPTLQYLQSIFGNRIISNKAAVEWPPYSPDLNPLDYWFWSELKSLIGEKDPKTIAEVKQLAVEICQTFDKPQIRRGIDDFLIRVECMEFWNGEHFEPYLKAFKTKMKGRSRCDFCRRIHTCDCDTCYDRCWIGFAENYLTQHDDDDEIPMDVENIDSYDSDDSEISDLDVENIDLLN